MSDAATLLQIAQRFSLPPALVKALDGRDIPPGLAASYGIDDATAKRDPTVPLMLLAGAVSIAARQGAPLEDALSSVFGSGPKDHLSPTSPTAGTVMGILASAATDSMSGMQGFAPADPALFGRVAKDFGGFLHSAAKMGGVITNDVAQAWQDATSHYAPVKDAPVSSRPTGDPSAPRPAGPHPDDVESFAGEAKALGIDLDHFTKHFPIFSALRHKMLERGSTLQDFAPMAGLGTADMLDHVRNTPHPRYPNITAGAYSDAHDVALLHAGDFPEPSEVARFASSGAKWGDIGAYYDRKRQGGAS